LCGNHQELLKTGGLRKYLKKMAKLLQIRFEISEKKSIFKAHHLNLVG